MTFDTLHLPTIILHAELEALNKHGEIKKASKELGISERTLQAHVRDNNIVKNRFKKIYYIKPLQHAYHHIQE